MLFQNEEKRNWDRAADVVLELRGNRLPTQAAGLFRCLRMLAPNIAAPTTDATPRPERALNATRPGAAGRKKGNETAFSSPTVRDYIWRERILPSFGAAGTAPEPELLDEHLDSIRECRAARLKGLPMSIYVLARHAQQRGRTFTGIKIIRPTGGKFSKVMAHTVEQAFGAPVRENYGAAELGTIAFDCQHNRAQHLLGELFVIEFLRNGQPVGPGELGELVITDLRNRSSPLIRYRIGDVGRYFAGPCQCGFEGLLFTVDGRLQETVVTRAGRAVSGTEIIDCLLAPGGDRIREGDPDGRSGVFGRSCA